MKLARITIITFLLSISSFNASFAQYMYENYKLNYYEIGDRKIDIQKQKEKINQGHRELFLYREDFNEIKRKYQSPKMDRYTYRLDSTHRDYDHPKIDRYRYNLKERNELYSDRDPYKY